MTIKQKDSAFSPPRRRKGENQEKLTERVLRIHVEAFQLVMQGTFRQADGSPVDLFSAKLALDRHWVDPKASNEPRELDLASARNQLATLIEEENRIKEHVASIRQWLAELESPFQEGDILRHDSGARARVVDVASLADGFMMALREVGTTGRLKRPGQKWILRGAAEVVGWHLDGGLGPHYD